MILRGLLLTLIAITGAMDVAARTLELPERMHDAVDVAPYISIHYDQDRSAGITEIAQLPARAWQANTSSFIHLGFSDAAVWFKFDVLTAQLSADGYLLHLKDAIKDEVDVYLLHDSQVLQHLSARPNQSFAARPVPHRNFLFPLPLEPHRNYQVYVRVTFAQHIMLPIELTRRDTFFVEEQKSLTLLAMGAGLLLVMAIYNLFIYFSTRQSAYLYYVGWVVSSALYFLGMNGLSYQYLWPQSPDWGDSSHLVFSAGSFLFASLFTMKILNIDRRSTTGRLLQSFMLLAAITVVASLANWFVVANQVATVTGLMCWSTCFVLGLRAWLRGQQFAAYTTLAWFLLACGNFVLCLGFLRIIPFSLLLMNLAAVALMAETVLNSVALASRIKIIEREHQQAIADNKAQHSFLARMSHELRTPMNGILGMVELLADRVQDSTSRRYVQIINSSSTTLLRIINDILDYSKIEAGKMELESIPFDLTKVIRDSLDLQRVHVADKPVELDASVAPEIPRLVVGDPTRISQILFNLVNNAVKFTERGRVSVHASYEDPDHNLIRLCVQDTGVGIPAAKQNQIFNAFEQLGASTSRTYGGSGLGLNITRQLTNLMGGDLIFTSEAGKGSRFCATLNLPPARLTAIQPQPATNAIFKKEPAHRSLRVLIAEDNPVNQLVIKGQLEKLGHEPTIVDNGRLAVDEIRNPHQTFDLVLMDCEMPEMDGFEATRNIRSWEQTHDHTPIPVYALTAHVLPEQEESCYAAGMDALLTKPLGIEVLRQKLSKLAAAQTAST